MSHTQPFTRCPKSAEACETPVMTTVVPQKPGVVTVMVSGEVDLATRPDLEATVHRALAARPWKVTIDMSGVTFCSLAGVNALLDLRHAAGEAGSRLEIRPSAGLSRLLRVTELTDAFPTASR
jgi:anti-sigma B factor antagonist